MNATEMVGGEGQTHRKIIVRQHAAIDVRLEGFALKAHGGADMESLHGALLDLLMDMSMHFGYEESLMDARGYAEFDHHRRQHLALMTELGLLLDRLQGLTRVDNDLLRSVDFLAVWYRRHVESSDRALDEWLVS